MTKEVIIAICIGIGLSASTGFRVFIPMLAASVAGYFKIIPLNDSFSWLAGAPALISFATAAVVEIIAYYIPVVDHFLDILTTPLALVAGTLLTASVIPSDSEWMKWGLGILLGGGSAGVVQAGTVVTRMITGKTTLTTGNAVVATGENAGAVAGSGLTLLAPVVAAVLFILFIGWIISKLIKKRKKKI